MRAFILSVFVASLIGCGGGDKDGATPGGTGNTGGTKIDSPVVGKWTGGYKQKPLSKLAEPDERMDVKITLDLKSDGTFTDDDHDGTVSNGTYELDFKDNAGSILLKYPNLHHKFDIKLNGDKLSFSKHRFVKDGNERVPDQLRIDDHELTRVK